MSFANPAGWWLATLVIPIIALHILKAQRTQVEVASTLEWESIDRPVAAARPWQRLRWSIPLLLQLLAVALLAAALAGPALNTGRTSAEHVVIMVDTSSSMGGTDGSPTRVDEARGQVSKVVDGLGATTRVSLISTGAPAQILAGGLRRPTSAVAWTPSGHPKAVLTPLPPGRWPPVWSVPTSPWSTC